MPPGKKHLEELRAKLRAPIPEEAIKPDSRRSWLSSINPAYVIERLNDCFGEDGWEEKYTVKESNADQSMIVVLCELKITRHLKTTRRAFGGNDNDDRGDAYKGACTDALTKAASKLGIGADVYKGLHDNKFLPDPEETSTPRRDAGKKLAKFQVQGFIDAIARTGKTDAQVNEFLNRECGITSIEQMTRGVFQMAINWANWDGKSDPRKVESIDAGRQKQPTPVPAPAPEEGPRQKGLFS